MIGVLIGRFQPFTLGHLKAFKYFQSQNPNAAIALVVRESGRLDRKNPFTVCQRKNWIKDVLPEIKIYEVRNAYYEDVFEDIGEEVQICVGEDRAEVISQQPVEYCVVPRVDSDISATKVRTALRQDNIDEFKKMMPAELHGKFEEMKCWIKSEFEMNK